MLHPQTCHGLVPLGATSWLHPIGDTAAGQLCLGAEGGGAAFWGRDPWVRDTPVPRIPRQPHPNHPAGMCAQGTNKVSSAPLGARGSVPGVGELLAPSQHNIWAN